jgi:molybdopterin converting factor small subunit
VARILLTRALAAQTDGATEHQIEPGDVRGALTQLISRYPQLQRYLLTDQAHLREHINVFVNDELVSGRERLADRVAADDTVFVLQSVSGGRGSDRLIAVGASQPSRLLPQSNRGRR